MKRSWFTRFCFLIMLGFFFSKNGFPAVEPFTLSQAFLLAEKNNLESQALQKKVEALEGNLLQAKLLLNPSLEFEQKTSPIFSFRKGEYTVLLSQEIETGGKRAARIRVAERALEEAKWQRSDFARLLREKVRRQYSRAWIAQQQTEVLNQILRDEETFQTVNAGRLKLGEISEMEYNLFQSEYFLAKQQALEAEQNRQLEWNRMAELLFLPVEAPLPLEELPFPFAESLQEKALVEEAFSNRPDLLAGKKEIERLEAVAGEEQSKAFPNFTVGLGINPQLQPNQPAQNLYLMRLTLPLPLFDRNQGSIQQAMSEVRSQELNKDSLRKKIEIEVRNAYQAYSVEKGIHENFRNMILPLARQNLKTVKAAYQFGGETIFDVIQAEKTYLNAESQSLENFQRYADAAASLESAVNERWQ